MQAGENEAYFRCCAGSVNKLTVVRKNGDDERTTRRALATEKHTTASVGARRNKTRHCARIAYLHDDVVIVE